MIARNQLLRNAFFADLKLLINLLHLYCICCVGWVDTQMTLKIRTCARNGNIANKTSLKSSTLCGSSMRSAKYSGMSRAAPSLSTTRISQMRFRLPAPDRLSSTTSMVTRDITTPRPPRRSLGPSSASTRSMSTTRMCGGLRAIMFPSNLRAAGPRKPGRSPRPRRRDEWPRTRGASRFGGWGSRVGTSNKTMAMRCRCTRPTP